MKYALKKAFVKTIKQIKKLGLKIIAIVIIASILRMYLDVKKLSFSTGNFIVDSMIGGAVGSILTGNPINGYIIANSLLSAVSSAFIMSFLLSWVTVGLAQLPLEIELFGKRFAVVRNFIGYIFAVLGGILFYIMFKG